MKKWYRLTALVLAFAIVLSTVSGALAQVEVDYSEYQTWVADTKAANGLAGVISIDEGGEVRSEPSTFTGELNQGPLYIEGEDVTLGAYVEGQDPVSVALNMYGKVNLVAPAAGQWQVYIGNDQWVNVSGETGSTFALTFAKVQSLFMTNGAAQLRCVMSDGTASETVNVGISYEAAVLPANTEEDAASTLNQTNYSGDYGIALAADTPELGEYSIVINYVFENNAIAADPYTATLAAGSNFSATVNHPTVMGYLPYVDNETETSTEIDINVTNIQANITHTVTYKPTNVNYTVIHYQQNVDNDNYTIAATETLQGLTKSIVPEVAAGADGTVSQQPKYDGFYALLYEKPAIAADGSTVVEVYYDRYYYLMNFELDGGYGVEPIYARYEAPVGTIATPTRAGYTFNQWSPAVPATVPVNGGTYTAQWTMNDTAKVTVVFWGENADDEEYSYLSTTEMELQSGSQYIYGGATLTCTQEAHKHIDSCLKCTEVEHTHSESCYTLICTTQVHTTHTPSCYSGSSSSASDLSYYAPANPEEGKVYALWWGDNYIYINGKWYEYNGSTSAGSVASTNCTIHEHTDYTGSCYEMKCTLTAHTHSNDCYVCGKTAHRHNADCFSNDPAYPVTSERYLWNFAGSDVVTVAADGSTVVNVYYDRTSFTLTFRRNNTTVKTINEKWGADIHDQFPIKDGSATMWWSVPNGTTSLKPGTEFGSLDTMPPENITFTYDSQTSAAVLHYYVEVLDGEPWTYEHDGKHFKLYKDINVTNSSGVYLTYTEEFHDIIGFKQYWSDPAFDKLEQGGTTDGINDENWLCYTRNAFDIVYYNPTELIKTIENVPFETALNSTTYNWTPTSQQAPAKYEPGSVEFAGWYLNPECSGTAFDFSTAKMPAGPNNVNGEIALSLYAKWVPVTHTVEFYLDLDALNANTKISDTHPDLTVSHGAKVENVPAEPDNGDYIFVGWFYMEDGVEKAFDFANMPINKDMKVYGKWSSNTLKEYFVYFKIQGTDTEIADPITGSALAGHTKTFEAKGGTDLYTKYQEGYFPLVQSHSMTIDIENDANNVFTFWYVQKDAVPYTVYYVAETLKDGEDAAKYDTIERDGKTYYIIADTYTNSENRKAVVTEKFKVVSGYMPDAYQKRLIVDGTDGAVNEIIFYYSVDTTHAYYKITHYTQNTDGESWTEYASSQAVGEIGKTYTADPLTIDGFTYDSTVTGTVASGVLTAEGLELKLYYVRKDYPYKVRYLENGTGNVLAPEKKTDANGNPLTGKYGQVVSESAIDIPGYRAIDPTSQTLTIKIEESATEAKLNIITFYYEVAYTTLTVEKTGLSGSESAIVDVKVDGKNYTIVLNSTNQYKATIGNVLIGAEYSVTENADWTWRYGEVSVSYADTKEGDVYKLDAEASKNVVTVSNSKKGDKWLDNESSVKNVFNGVNPNN